MRGAAVRTGKVDRLGTRDGIALQRRIAGRTQSGRLAAPNIDAHDRCQRLRGAGDSRNMLRIDPGQVREFYIGQVELACGALLEIDHRQSRYAALPQTQHRARLVEQHIVCLAE
jgi:hypothetical protein